MTRRRASAAAAAAGAVLVVMLAVLLAPSRGDPSRAAWSTQRAGEAGGECV